jgi:hypothetical protein
MLHHPEKVSEWRQGMYMVLEEMDLLVCRKSKVAHLVFLKTLCSRKFSNGDVKWNKIGKCQTYYEYAVIVRELGYEPCRDCYKSLERSGFKQNESAILQL